MSVVNTKTWVVIPGYNESKYVDRVLSKVSAITTNVIFVDDGSTDNTTHIAKKYTPHVLTHEINLGKGAALKTGCDYAFKHCGAQAVILMDADDQHSTTELGLFQNKLDEGYDVVFGARKRDTAMPFIKRVSNFAASLVVKFFFGGPLIPDIPSGYKAFKKKVLKQILWVSPGYQVEMEIACRVSRFKLRFAVVSIDTIYHDHDKGMTLLNTLDFLHSVVLWRLTL